MDEKDKAAIDRKHEAKARAMARKIKRDPEWANVHYLLDAEDNPRLKVMNEVLAKQARRKLN
jgi:hypothetical protein